MPQELILGSSRGSRPPVAEASTPLGSGSSKLSWAGHRWCVGDWPCSADTAAVVPCKHQCPTPALGAVRQLLSDNEAGRVQGGHCRPGADLSLGAGVCRHEAPPSPHLCLLPGTLECESVHVHVQGLSLLIFMSESNTPGFEPHVQLCPPTSLPTLYLTPSSSRVPTRVPAKPTCLCPTQPPPSSLTQRHSLRVQVHEYF